MGKCSITKNGRPLSGFYPNGINDVFKFRKNDYMSFSTQKEANGKLKSIKRELSDKSNQERYGEKVTKQHLNTYKKLKVGCI